MTKNLLASLSTFAAVATASNKGEVNEVWTDSEIKTFVGDNFSGMSWSALNGNQNLVSKDQREQTATKVANKLVNDWTLSLTELPDIRTPGVIYRNRRFNSAIVEITSLWKQAFERMDTIITRGKSTTKRVVDDAYVEAYECAPDCTCENIKIEYDKILRW